MEDDPRQCREVFTMKGDLLTTLAQSIAENPSSKWVLLGGHPCATSDFFFKDGSDRPVALAAPGCWYFLDPDDARRRDERIAGLGRSQLPTERKFELELFEQIAAAGRLVSRQVRTASGIIDLLIEGKPPTLIEVKANGDIFSIAHAAAQLWNYAREYPGARLFVAAPPPVSTDAEAFLKRLGMALWN
jgi:hypothetical protein